MQHHEMYLVNTHPSGAQEWLCPICYRRFLLQLQPEGSKLKTFILEEGDVQISHIGVRDSQQIQVTEIEVSPVPDDEAGNDEPELPDELLKALEEILKDVDFGD